MSSTVAKPPETNGSKGPILQPVDFEYIAHPLFTEGIQKRLEWNDGEKLDATRVIPWRTSLVEQMKVGQSWVELVAEWLACAAGIELPVDEAMNLFVDVLWERSQKNDQGAIDLLSHSYKLFFSEPWPKNNLFVQDVESDPETSDREPAGTQHNDSIKLPLTPTPSLFHSRMHSKWRADLIGNSEGQLGLCRVWAQDFNSFFIHKTIKSPNQVILALRQMRVVSASVYKTDEWIHFVKDTGLSEVLQHICHPSTHLELSEPSISASYRNHCWKESLGEVLENWTPKTMDTDMIIYQSATGETTPFSVKFFMEALSSHDCIIPTASNPTSAFFLMSKDNFEQAWDHWLQPSLEYYGFDISQWNTEQVYRETRGIDLKKFISNNPSLCIHPRLQKILELTSNLRQEKKKTKQYSFQPQVTSSSGTYKTNRFSSSSKGKKARKTSHHTDTPHVADKHHLAPLHIPSPMSSTDASLRSSRDPTPEISTVKAEEMNLDLDIDDITKGRGSCRLCAGLSSKDYCTQYIELQERSAKHLLGNVLTCTDDKEDRVAPKKTANSINIEYFTPKDLMLIKVAHRPDVYKRCGKDSVVLLDAATQNLIGAVRFKGFSDKVYNELKDKHYKISQFKPVKRGSSFQNWDYGTMRAVGSRAAQGGKAGDAYTVYAGIEGVTDENLEALFSHAYANALRTVSETICPELRQVLRDNDKESSALNRLGSTGDTLFVCNDYMSPQHVDNDVGIGLCCQLTKNALLDEFGFAYSQWGAYIETQNNTVWAFYSQHIHGTIMPRRSSLDAARKNPRVVMSSGTHEDKRKKDANKARKYQTIRNNYAQRSQIWRRL